MKKKLLLCLFLTLPLLGNAQLLWEISGNHLKQKSYLFGSHHLVPISFLDSIKGIYPAFNSCENVVGEIILDDPSVIKKLQQAAVITTGKTTKDWLTDAQYELADSILKSTIEMGLQELRFFKPAMIENIYVLALYDRYFQRDEDFQIDSYFQKIGKKEGKRLFSLETVEEQIQLLLESKSLEEQAQSLYETLTSSADLLTQIEALNEKYLAQDLDGLLELNNNDTTQTEEERFALIDKRNIRWAEILPKQLALGNNFIIVGAMHLPGENGLIHLLQKQGYKVKPVR